MIRDEAVDIILRAVGNRKDKREDTVAAFVSAQEQMETTGDFYPWFLETENASQFTVMHEERVQLPSDFLSEIENDALWIISADAEIPLTRRPLDLMKANYPKTQFERPLYYDVSSIYLRLRPIPDQAYQLRMSYIGRDAPLTDNIENRWLKYASQWLIGSAGLKIAAEVGHSMAMKKFQTDIDVGKRGCYVQSEARIHTNQIYYLGS
jgi:hypothetical protein